MRNIFIIFLLLTISIKAWAQNSSLNLSIPSPNGSYQSDRFRSGELDCSNAIGGGTNFEFGVTGIINRSTDPFNPDVVINNNKGRDIGVYARITIPLDGPEERINCNTLYELELRKKRIEVERLQQELNNLRKLQFEK
jgi:hypothetical protein